MAGAKIPGSGGRGAGLKALSASEKMSACDERAPAGYGGPEATGGLVTRADLWLAFQALPRRRGDARVTRDDLPHPVRAGQRRVEKGTTCPPAKRADDAQGAPRLHRRSAARTDQTSRLDP